MICLMLCGVAAPAHELEDNRATLVLRDKTHVSVTLFVRYTEALHLALAPQQPYTAFLIVYSTMDSAAFEKELLRAQAKFQASIRILQAETQVTMTNWLWPGAKQVQAMMQNQIMQATVDPGGHAHQETAEIRADAVAPKEISGVTMQFPDEFRRMLVVSYRPNQVWVDPKGAAVEIRF